MARFTDILNKCQGSGRLITRSPLKNIQKSRCGRAEMVVVHRTTQLFWDWLPYFYFSPVLSAI
jgi:hypothetical protein